VVSGIILLVVRIVLALLLYAFIGFALFTLLRDLKKQGDLLAARQPPTLTLTNHLEDGGKSQRYIKPVVILGREPGCDFSLDDQTVSSQHARLTYRKQQWWLEDLASTNGTFLNGEAVTTAVVITQGDELRLGLVGVQIEIGQGTDNLPG
jgi:hypothetical protein